MTTAETRLAEAQTALDAAKAEGSRRTDQIAEAQAAVAAAQAHAEEVGRESVTLQNNPAVAAYRTRKGWTAPGGSAANTVAAANARAQSDHARRLTAAEADLAAARAAFAVMKPVDVKAIETELVAARQGVERARAADPMHRLAAAIYRGRDRGPERRCLRVGAPGRDPEHRCDRLLRNADRRPDLVAARSQFAARRQSVTRSPGDVRGAQEDPAPHRGDGARRIP